MKPPFLQSAPGADPVIAEGIFPASPARVYRAWTEAEAMRQWFGSAKERIEVFEIDLRLGGNWTARFAPDSDGFEELTGHYVEIEANARLAFTWQHHRVDPQGNRESTRESLVTIQFKPHGTATLLTLVHSKVQTEGGRQGVGSGWNTVLGRLADSLAG